MPDSHSSVGICFLIDESIYFWASYHKRLLKKSGFNWPQRAQLYHLIYISIGRKVAQRNRLVFPWDPFSTRLLLTFCLWGNRNLFCNWLSFDFFLCIYEAKICAILSFHSILMFQFGFVTFCVINSIFKHNIRFLSQEQPNLITSISFGLISYKEHFKHAENILYFSAF